VPGTGSAPDRAPLEAAKRLVRTPVDPAAWRSDAAYRYGARLHAEGFFWEAHEVWEAVWMACAPNAPERRLLRALIQLANAALKLRMDRRNAALRLLREAESLLGEVAASTGEPRLMGIALAPLRDTLRELAGDLSTGSDDALDRLSRLLRPVADGWTPAEHEL
jgi:predicted metal-dependent hydrolase